MLNLGMRQSIYLQLQHQPIPSMCPQARLSALSPPRACQRRGPEKTNGTQFAQPASCTSKWGTAGRSPPCWVCVRPIRSCFILLAKAVAPPRTWWPLGHPVVLSPASAWRPGAQGAQCPRRGGGVGAEGSCVHPMPFCTAMLFSCRSYAIAPALGSDAIGRSRARNREHTQTRSPPAPAPCTPARTCARSPAPQRAALLMCRHRAPSARRSHMPTHMLAPSRSAARHP